MQQLPLFKAVKDLLDDGPNLLRGAFQHLCDLFNRKEEHLLVSKALSIFRASYYFCARSDVTLLYEAYDFSSQSEV